MALFHVNAMVIHKTHSNPGAAGLSQYLRSGVGDLRRYMERADPGREDLVEYGEAGLPSWAKNGTHFFAMANQFEARKDGVVGRHYQFTLPRELDDDGRTALAHDIRQVFFAQFPHVYALHNPQAQDNSGEQPHLHVLLSPRRDDGMERRPKVWFAGLGEGAQGRVPIDRTWGEKRTLQGVRYETMLLTNAALDQVGYPVAVSHDTIRGLGLDRDAGHYSPHMSPGTVQKIKAEQVIIREDWHPWEQDTLLRAWQDTKVREQLTDLSRDAMVDHCRDRFWLHDRSPLREAERDASVERTLVRGFHNAGLDRMAVQEAREAQRQRGQLSTERPPPAHGRRTALRALLAEEEGLGRHGHDLAIRLHTEGEGRGR